MTSIVVSLALIIQPSVQVEHAPSAVPWMSREVSDASPVPPGGFAVVASPLLPVGEGDAAGLDPGMWVEAVNDAPTDAIDAPPPPLLIPSDDALWRLRMCESTDRYAVNTDNGYWGAYQFDQSTWDGVAERHALYLRGMKPSNASPSDQDAMARWLYSERGRQPWPVCGRVL